MKDIREYIDDIDFGEVLFGKTLYSTIPSGEILSIEIPNLPDGYFIVDRRDVPLNRVKVIDDEQPVFAERFVNYVGEPILLVVGKDKEILKEIIKEIKVHYREREKVLTIDEAIERKREIVRYEFRKGNVEDAFASAFDIVEGVYETGYQEHLYLETNGMVGIYENGKVSVFGSMQCPYYVKKALVYALKFPEDKVRVVQAKTGGGFGGKEDYPSLLAIQVAVASIKCKKPVKVVYDRKEDFIMTTKRHPSKIIYRSALDKNYRIVGMDVKIYLDGGAYTTLSPVVLQRAMFSAGGVYNIPNIKVEGVVLRTNKVPSGAMRGFGAPQNFFAIEMHIDDIVLKHNLNPYYYRRLMMIKTNDKTVTGGTYRGEIKIIDMLDNAVKKTDFIKKYERYKKSKNKGIGISCFFHGCGFTGSGEVLLKSTIKVKKIKDKIIIYMSNVDMGQKSPDGIRRIAAMALKIPLKNVIIEKPDTDIVPDSGPTVASRTLSIVGRLVKEACEEIKKNKDKDEIEIIRRFTLPEGLVWDGERFYGDAYGEYSFGINIAEVEYDNLTDEIKVLKIYGLYDVGNPVNEKYVHQQLLGGIVQGLGYAIFESLEIDSNGNFNKNSLTDYAIPTSLDIPEIRTEIYKTKGLFGPFGAKCCGELPFVGVAPAVCSAARIATGKKISKIPIKPEYLKRIKDES
uniref:Aldehyde oxidase n=1 Tax=candidate division WOR-3 bacterium TaxID=2052148 RepID=A0A7C4UDQ9_UNCW3